MTTTRPIETAATPTVPRWRRLLAAMLIVLGCVLAPLSVAAVWTRNTLLSTDQYVDTVAPLAENAAITDRVATRAVDALFAEVDIQGQVRDVLPDRAVVIAPAITAAVERLASDAAHRFVQSDAFATLWREANRLAHAQVRNLLTGEGRVVDGKVVVDLGPVVVALRDRLEGLGLDVFSGAADSATGGDLVLFESQTLKKVQSGVDLLQTLAVVLPIVTVLLLAAGVLLAGDRRRALLRAALGVAGAMALVLIGSAVVRSIYLDAFRPEGRAAAGAAYDQVLGFLRLSLRTVFTLALVVAIAAWATGPGRLATRVRAGGRRLVGRAGDRVGADEVGLSGFGRAVARHRTPLRVLVVAFGTVLLMVWNRPTSATVLVVALLVVVVLAVLEVVARAGASVAASHE
ncbi:MAG TPA: hypothetical protein VFW06_03705 [Acidimicrobiia bacterium]|nr:hypothetical protein [Acidimicrobiia bacterium]